MKYLNRLFALTFLMSVSSAFATWSGKMQFRLDGEDAYKAPAGVGLGNDAPVFSNNGNIVFKYVMLNAQERVGLLLWNAAEQKTVTHSAPGGMLITDVVQCAKSGEYLYQTVDGGGYNTGLYALDKDLRRERRILGTQKKYRSLEPIVCSQTSDAMLLRGKTDDFEKTQILILKNGDLLPFNVDAIVPQGQKLSYIFKPSAQVAPNGDILLGFKYRYAKSADVVTEESPDGVALYRLNLAGESVLSTLEAKLEDRDSTLGNAAIAGFDNAVDVNKRGDLLFISQFMAGPDVKKREIRLLKHGTKESVVVASETARVELEKISYFTPSLGDDGRVAFRSAQVQNDKEFIWIWSEDKGLEMITRSADDVNTDLGALIFGQNQEGTTFFVGPRFNARGDLLVIGLVDKQSRVGIYDNRGLGVFVYANSLK